jgi:uncharacterized protein YuzE
MNKVTYDGVGDTLSILLSKKQIAYAEEHGVVIVNYDDKGKPVEIEILNASKFVATYYQQSLKLKPAKNNWNYLHNGAYPTNCSQLSNRKRHNNAKKP